MADRPSAPPDPAVPVRVQMLATEHWALLAARSTTQNEVLARIALLLTVLSAGLVTLGLVAQVATPGRPFAAVAFGVVALVWLIAVLTLVRVLNASEEDAVLVLAMNRLRGAYVAIDPEVLPVLVQSPHDDRAGLSTSYSFVPRATLRQVVASSAVFTLIVTAVLTGSLTATALAALGADGGAAIGAGVAGGIAFAAAILALEGRRLAGLWRHWTPLHPSSER